MQNCCYTKNRFTEELYFIITNTAKGFMRSIAEFIMQLFLQINFSTFYSIDRIAKEIYERF